MDPIFWTPLLPESTDGRPLTTHVSDFLVQNFPYDRVSTNIGLLLRPESVLGFVALYLVSEAPLKAIVKTIKFDGKSTAFRLLVGIHNLCLAIFSAIVMVNAYAVVGRHMRKYGFMDTYCDPNGTLWASGFGAWSTIFYISKYWEFMDTWILVLKVRCHICSMCSK